MLYHFTVFSYKNNSSHLWSYLASHARFDAAVCWFRDNSYYVPNVSVMVGSLAMELSAKVLCPDTVMEMRFKHCG